MHDDMNIFLKYCRKCFVGSLAKNIFCHNPQFVCNPEFALCFSLIKYRLLWKIKLNQFCFLSFPLAEYSLFVSVRHILHPFLPFIFKCVVYHFVKYTPGLLFFNPSLIINSIPRNPFLMLFFFPWLNSSLLYVYFFPTCNGCMLHGLSLRTFLSWCGTPPIWTRPCPAHSSDQWTWVPSAAIQRDFRGVRS